MNRPDDNEDAQSGASSKFIAGDEPTITMSDLTDSPTSPPETTTPDEATISMAGLRPGEARDAIRPETKSTGESTLAMPPIDPAEDRSTPPAAKTEGGSVVGFILQERYKLHKVLGQGGFGEVYLAEDLKLKRRCVVKRMLVKQRSARSLEIHRLNFKREAELLTELNDPGHSNIPEIYDYFSDEAGNYLVMKYIEGRNLKETLNQRNTSLPDQDVIRYAYNLCDALHYMHTYDQKQPILHRDIKPANIILGDDDRIWLVDFGLAKALPAGDEESDHDLTKASGSLGYTPLEQWFGEPVPTSDVYALGATLHHLLTNLSPADAYGQENFNIQILQQLHGQFAPIHKVNRQVSKTLSDIVASTLVPDPDQRPTALQLQQQLDILISGAHQDAPLFTFKAGDVASSKGRLVDLCDRHRQEAQGYLYRGDFERWFRLINRNDLAHAASKAVEQARNQQDGLERFLKLIFPNLFLRRMRRASLHTMRATLFIVLGVILAVSISAVIGSYLAGFVVQRAIARHPWNFEQLKPTYTEFELNEIAQRNTEGALDRIQVDVRPPDQVDINLNWSGILLFLTFEQEEQTPYFQLAEINGFSFPFPFDLLTRNISRGLNQGLDETFSQAPVDIVALEMKEKTYVVEDELFAIDSIQLTIAQKSSGSSPPPTVAPNQSRPPPPDDGNTRLLVFNQLEQDIILEIAGRSWEIPAGEQRLVETKSGILAYTITRVEDGQILSQGNKTWRPKSYNLYIHFDDENLQLTD